MYSTWKLEKEIYCRYWNMEGTKWNEQLVMYYFITKRDRKEHLTNKTYIISKINELQQGIICCFNFNSQNKQRKLAWTYNTKNLQWKNSCSKLRYIDNAVKWYMLCKSKEVPSNRLLPLASAKYQLNMKAVQLHWYP